MQAGKSENGIAHTGKKTITENIRKGEKAWNIYNLHRRTCRRSIFAAV